MLSMWTWMQSRLVRDERGASLVEYGLLVALIAVVALVAIRTLGSNVSENLQSVSTAITP
jgi:pilus assembly protein Flp/PilA